MKNLIQTGETLFPRVAIPLLICTVLLSACAEPEFILPGKRESVQSILDPEQALQENETRPVSLPAASANANWTQDQGTPATRVAHPALAAPLTQIWSADIGAGDSRKQRINATPVVANGIIYTLDAEARVTATSLSGARVWDVDLVPLRGRSGQGSGGGLAVADGRLYVALNFGVLVALDATNGQQIWSQSFEGTASGAPTVSGGIVYLTVSDDRGWAVSAEDGRQLWQLIASPDVNNAFGAPAPAVSDDLAIFAFGSGEVQAVFRRGGLRRWEASVAGVRPGTALGVVVDVTGAPVIQGNTVYVGNLTGRTVALDLNTGDRRWTADEGAVSRILVAGGSVFIISDLNDLVRLDASDGSTIWSVDLPRFTRERPRRRAAVFAHHGPALAGGLIHVASDDGLIRSFDPASGALQSSVEVPGGATSAPVIAGGVMYVVSTKGKLHAFR